MIRPLLVDEYRTGDAALLGGGTAVIDRAASPPRLIVRTGEALRVYELTSGTRSATDPVAVFPGRSEGPPIVGSGPVAPDLSHAVLVEEHSYRLVTRDGRVLWTRPAASARHVRWARSNRLWLAAPPDPGADGDTVCLLLLTPAGDELQRLVVPFGGRSRSVHLALHANGQAVAVGVQSTSQAATYAVGRDGELSLIPDRALLDAAPNGSGFVTVGRSGDTTDARWHDTGAVVTCADLLASEKDAEPGHIRPYLSAPSGGFLDADTLLLSLEDDYDEAEVEIFGSDRWRPSSHWLVASGRPHGMIVYPDTHCSDDLCAAIPLGDGTWLTHHGEAIHRWRVDH
ncbi:hypothetical protein Arub01_31280 [Actinomadura rubrobrunea]|uniref:Uncharacterized protein n=1 Tax=Actinomadura rubrobrunea TaxID=115335 RepID=A0A9W6PXJ4_9ACTN|nr:hypothetical protein [Actinomadura rubrobrunea]GLW64884.1 hypothetical protein Arub01_31280 [Actinomadura rubrobrunea]